MALVPVLSWMHFPVRLKIPKLLICTHLFFNWGYGIYLWSCGCVHVSGHGYGGQKSMSGVFLYHSPSLFFGLGLLTTLGADQLVDDNEVGHLMNSNHPVSGAPVTYMGHCCSCLSHGFPGFEFKSCHLFSSHFTH